ncbi:MAG: hypothetical protein R3321_13375, partial [Nitrososphaeraceae archaeon]|nr:hypothetical protein [Nitrososphaeraceae archaeon]
MLEKSIVGVFYKMPKNKKSHTNGWFRIWSENLDVPINQPGDVTKIAYLDHGVNFDPTKPRLNFYTGYTEYFEKKIYNLCEAEQIYSLDLPMPDYASMLNRRTDFDDNELLNRLYKAQQKAITLLSTDLKLKKMVIGDSHCAAWSEPGSMIVRYNGHTLYGRVKTNFELYNKYIKEQPHLEKVIISLGNIDLRHHFLRVETDWRKLYREYKEFTDYLISEYEIEVDCSIPWPIESTERKIPKTGYYKGQPYWGS